MPILRDDQSPRPPEGFHDDCRVRGVTFLSSSIGLGRIRKGSCGWKYLLITTNLDQPVRLKLLSNLVFVLIFLRDATWVNHLIFIYCHESLDDVLVFLLGFVEFSDEVLLVVLSHCFGDVVGDAAGGEDVGVEVDPSFGCLELIKSWGVKASFARLLQLDNLLIILVLLVHSVRDQRRREGDSHELCLEQVLLLAREFRVGIDLSFDIPSENVLDPPCGVDLFWGDQWKLHPVRQ